MSETKPFASLSSGLLARKGMAKPAMRPQGFGHFGGIEDLGWNDMGGSAQPAPEDVPERQPSSIAALTPGPVTEVAAAPEPAPAVVAQQRDLATQFEAPAPVVEAPKPARAKRQALEGVKTEAALPKSRVAPGTKGKAAFTLRLDPERHLRLRLACAVTRRSAQMIVTEALDTYLDGLTELDSVTPAKTH